MMSQNPSQEWENKKKNLQKGLWGNTSEKIVHGPAWNRKYDFKPQDLLGSFQQKRKEGIKKRGKE